MSTVTYVSPSAPKLTLSLTIDEKKRKIQFLNKQLHLDDVADAEIIVALDELLRTRPNVSQLIQKVDPAVAEALAKTHMAQMAKLRGTMTGPISSADLSQQARARMAERDATLAREGATPEDLAAMHKEIDKDTDLMLTEDGEQKIAPSTRDGFIADKQPEPIEAADTVTEPKEVFANLLGRNE